MTRHLSRDERLLALDGALDQTGREHLQVCAACRGDVEALGGVLRRVRAVDVPEPSPLFWDHLARRVGDAIAQEPPPAARRSWWAPRLVWATAALVATAVAAGYVARHRTAPSAPVTAHVIAPAASEVERAAPAPPAELRAAPEELAADGGWALIAAAADDGGADAFAPLAGQAEWSIASLSAEERAALAQELAAELAPRPGREG